MRRICRRAEGGGYLIKGKHYEKCVGTRAEVGHGTAYKTSGGLIKSKLLHNKHGRWVSKSLSTRAKKERRLEKAGYFTKKGKFGFVFRDVASKKKTRKRKTSKKRKQRSCKN